jgi:ribosomal protein L6P/L9E
MAQYKVKALTVGGKGKKIFKSGQTVTDRDFPPGNAELMVAQGFLTKMDTDTSSASLELEEDNTVRVVEKEPVTSFPSETKVNVNNQVTIPGIDDIDVEDIKAALDKADKVYNPNSTKQQLYDMYISMND